MNNSKVTLENLEKKEDNRLSLLRELQGELSQLVEAINRVEQSEDWQKLKKLFLNKIIDRLERQLRDEASKPNIDLPKLYRLQGQIDWANKYSDLKKISSEKRLEIENLKKQINEYNPRDGAL